jgi:quercetin dioxygenase-like cupin family protein
MKITLLVPAFVAGLVAAAPSMGAGPPVFAQPLALGTMPATVIHAKAGALLLDSLTIKPGGSFGWHTHGSPVAVIVTKGTLTVLDPSVNKCAPFRVHKGQAFVEPANHIHLARNDGKTAVKAYATYLGLPKGVMANLPSTAPSGCGG